MMKKIEETRKQAERMQRIHDDNSKKYDDKVRFMEEEDMRIEE